MESKPGFRGARGRCGGRPALMWLLITVCGGAAGLEYTPPNWGTPAQTIHLAYDPLKTPAENGAALKSAVYALTAGQRLVVGSGTYAVNSHFGPTLNGSEGAPIVIEGDGVGEAEISNDPSHNIMELTGSYVILRNLAFRGGSIGLRLHSCHHVWIDRCHIHDTPEYALAANTYDTHAIHITGNTIHDTQGAGEGMYLGANYGAAVMHSSFIVGNHVYNTGGVQGDGIELKQGSWGNVIADNLVHDCHYPCILVYGTGGNPPNIVERNICYNSGDNAMQVQGEAIVRNNLVIGGANAAFQSHDHQGATRDLQVVNNTFVNVGRAAVLISWNAREGMVFANNACYSQAADGLRFSNGSAGVTVAGNVVFGGVSGVSSGFIPGQGLAEDFVDLAYDASRRDARPAEGSALVGAADPAFVPEDDISGRPRGSGNVAGAYAHGPGAPREGMVTGSPGGLAVLILAILLVAGTYRALPVGTRRGLRVYWVRLAGRVGGRSAHGGHRGSRGHSRPTSPASRTQ